MAGKLNSSKSRNETNQANYWPLQDAKARFSELVRRVKSDGPQHVTIHGQDQVVVISTKEYHRLLGELSGEALVAAFQLCPDHDLLIESGNSSLPFSDPVSF